MTVRPAPPAPQPSSPERPRSASPAWRPSRPGRPTERERQAPARPWRPRRPTGRASAQASWSGGRRRRGLGDRSGGGLRGGGRSRRGLRGSGRGRRGAGAAAGAGAGFGAAAGPAGGAGGGAAARAARGRVVGALTGAARIAAAATAATGAVTPATGRSAAAVDVAKLQADTKAANARTRELRRTRRVPCGPISRSCRRVRSCGPRKYNGFPQAWRRRSCCTCSSPEGPSTNPPFGRSDIPLTGPSAPLEADFDRSARAERLVPETAQRRRCGSPEPQGGLDKTSPSALEATA